MISNGRLHNLLGIAILVSYKFQMLYLGKQPQRIWSTRCRETFGEISEVQGHVRLQSCCNGSLPPLPRKNLTCLKSSLSIDDNLNLRQLVPVHSCKLNHYVFLYFVWHLRAQEPENCVVMHENHAKQWLVNMVGDDDWTLQEAAAGCIANIRHLALANDIDRSQRWRNENWKNLSIDKLLYQECELRGKLDFIFQRNM